jgi:tRNA(fMet)-specific endonuclease VapC
MNLALDTNAYVEFARGDETALARVQKASTIVLPFVVLAELRAGFLHGSHALANERNLARFLGRPRIRVLYADDETTHHYARLFLQLRRQGTPIPTNDLWIGALVVQHGLHLYARDRHFDHIPQIPRA